MNNLRKFGNRCSTDPQGRTICPHQMRKTRFNRVVAPLQRVILGIRNLWPVIGMIKLIMMGNFTRQPFQFRSGFGFGQFSTETSVISGAKPADSILLNITKKWHRAYTGPTLRTCKSLTASCQETSALFSASSRSALRALHQ